MALYYAIDPAGFYLGSDLELDDGEGMPPGYAFVSQPPPTPGESQFVRQGGDGWVLTTEGPPTPVDPALAVPVAVDMRQAELKLHSEPHGDGTRLDAVSAYVATQDPFVQIEWRRASELRRDHPMVGIMGFFFGLSADDLDQWFREAKAIGPTLAL